jgi:hypothetical protein
MTSGGCHMEKRWNSRMLVLSADTVRWQDICSGNKQFTGVGMTTKINIFYSNFIQGQFKGPGLFYWRRNINFFYISKWTCFSHACDETWNLENPSHTSTKANSRKRCEWFLRSLGTSRRVAGWWVLDVFGPPCCLERSGTNYPGTQCHVPEERIPRSE